MNIEILQQIIREGQELIPNITLVQRPFHYEEKGNYVFVGLRQVGKSYMLYARMQELMRSGHNIREMVYINFDDERIDLQSQDLDLIIQAHKTMSELAPIFFFDEIQNVEGWERFARRLANQQYQVYITGSNAKMLSREIATTLGGRYWNVSVYPYSFHEYLNATQRKLSDGWQYGGQDADINRWFSDYFYYGGMPQIPSIETKRAWLNDIFSKILFNDIVVRNNVRNDRVLRLVISRLAENVKQPLALNRLMNIIKSTGNTLSNNTLEDFMQYIEDSCMIFPVENYAGKFSERNSVKKHYFTDNGLLNIFLKDPNTSLLENIVAIELRRRYGDDFYFYRNGVEIDFYVPDEKIAIQVAWSLAEDDTRQREINALEVFAEKYEVEKSFIITRNETSSIISDKEQKINVIPVWRWMLQI